MRQRPEGPLYLESNRRQRRIAWTIIALHAGFILWLGAWLAMAPAAAIPGPLGLLALLPVGLFIADWLSGLVHWATDTWFDEMLSDRVISIAREHHLYPQHIIGYGFRDYVAYSSGPALLTLGPPALLLTLGLAPSGWTWPAVALLEMLAVLMVFGTHFHRLGHRRSRWRLVRWLQDTPLLVGPRHHGVHHGGGHDIRYCVVNGWANFVCDRLGFWRWLEGVVQRVTGAVPRQNDHAWFARFAADPAFVAHEQDRVRRSLAAARLAEAG
jgi:ubiquitin-conjugating enzyme E2 variant